jgi:hypothetical protein
MSCVEKGGLAEVVFWIKSEVVLIVCIRLTSGTVETRFFVLENSHR